MAVSTQEILLRPPLFRDYSSGYLLTVPQSALYGPWSNLMNGVCWTVWLREIDCWFQAGTHCTQQVPQVPVNWPGLQPVRALTAAALMSVHVSLLHSDVTSVVVSSRHCCSFLWQKWRKSLLPYCDQFYCRGKMISLTGFCEEMA